MTGGAGETFLVAFLIAAMVVPLIALGVVCWLFLRAKRREDAKEKEREWRNEPSS
jgi:hypothetical protein